MMRLKEMTGFWRAIMGFCLMIALAWGALVGCGGEQRPQGESVRAVRISQGSDLLSLDPYFRLESPSFCIQRNIFDPLTDIDADMQLIPCLATGWENVSPTLWRFELRRGVTFHDGQPFDADDVVFSLERAFGWDFSKVKGEIQTFKAVRAIDTHTVEIETVVPDAILPTRLASILILDRESNEAGIAASGQAYLATHANGTGPYRVAEWKKDTICALETAPGHWAGEPPVKRLEFIPISNDATRLAALQRGKIDLMVYVPPTSVDRVESLEDYRVVRQPSLRLIYLGMDVGRDHSPGVAEAATNPLRDRRVREAIALGIDNRLIIKTIMAGNAASADQLLPEGVIGHDPALTLDRPDAEGARRLLAEAGYPEGFKVQLDGPNDRYVNDAKILQAVASQLARIGIQVEVSALPKARFFDLEARGESSFFLMGWSNTNGDGISTFDHLLHTRDDARGLGGANASTNYSNPEIDRICDEASREFDPARRAALLREANRLAMADLVHLPLHFQMDIYAVSDKVIWSPRHDTQVRGIDLKWAEEETAGSTPATQGGEKL